jgi:glycosyltransferase involved in cell wall biosynthesis
LSTGPNLRVAFVANYASHSQVDLYNALSRHDDLSVKVFYLRNLPPGRQWKEQRNIEHDAQFIREIRWNPYFYWSPGLIGALSNFKADVVVVTQYASIGMQAVMYWCALRIKKWIFWSESPGVAFTELPIFRTEILRRGFRKVALLPLKLRPAAVWGISAEATKIFAEISGVPSRQIPYYFDQTALRKVPVRKWSSGRPFTFLYAGKLVERKGFDILARAVELLVAEGQNFRVLVAGDGPLKDAPMDAAAAARIEFLGFREIDQMPDVYASADALVFPSRYDGWGLPVAEAMASALPVIGSVGSACAREVLVDGSGGIAVPAQDVSALATAMRRWIINAAAVPEMGAIARAKIEIFDTTHGAATVSAALREVVSR